MRWVSVNSLASTQMSAKARYKPTWPDQGHGRMVRLDVWANSPSEGGASGDRACARPAGAPTCI